MKKLTLAIAMSCAVFGTAAAQQKSVKEQIVGSWALVSVVNEADGKKFTNPRTPSGAILQTVWKRAPAL